MYELLSLVYGISTKYARTALNIVSMRGSRKLCQRGSNFTSFLGFLEGRDDPSKYHYKRAMIGLSAKRHLNGVWLACRQWPKIEFWLGSFVIFQGIRTRFAKKPYVFVIFQEGSRLPVPPSGSAHGFITLFIKCRTSLDNKIQLIADKFTFSIT